MKTMKKSLIYVPFVFTVTLLTITCFRCSTNSNANSKTSDISKLEEIYKGKVVLIVNGDDVGVTQIFTDATIDAYLKGGISSASIIATGHDVERAIMLLKKHRDLLIGIHLTLTGDWKPLTSGASLHDTSGLMWNTTEEVARKVIPGEAAVEWDAQIKKVIDAGINVTHIDSHMGCYFVSQELYIAAFNLAKKYKIPLTLYTGIYRLQNKDETLENRAAAYWQMIGGFKPGIYYLFSHQGWEPPNKVISGDLDLRINDYKFWTSEDTKKQLIEKGYIMIGCAPLKEEFQIALRDVK
jgi:hypothetical protein